MSLTRADNSEQKQIIWNKECIFMFEIFFLVQHICCWNIVIPSPHTESPSWMWYTLFNLKVSLVANELPCFTNGTSIDNQNVTTNQYLNHRASNFFLISGIPHSLMMGYTEFLLAGFFVFFLIWGSIFFYRNMKEFFYWLHWERI